MDDEKVDPSNGSENILPSVVDAANVVMAMHDPDTGELKPINLVSLFGELFRDFGALIQRVEALEKQLKDEDKRIVTV